MTEQVIFTDANELILLLKANVGRESHVFNCTDVQRISFGYGTARRFKVIPVTCRRITIICKKLGTIEFDEVNHKQFFDQYLDMLRKYCAENRVTFYDFEKK